MSDILATSEELSKIIERAVNRIGENHALARDNKGLTLTNKDTIVIEEALEDAAKDMAEKMVLENNINNIVKEQVKAIGGGSGFAVNQGGSDSLAKFTKRQEMGEQGYDDREDEIIDPRKFLKCAHKLLRNRQDFEAVRNLPDECLEVIIEMIVQTGKAEQPDLNELNDKLADCSGQEMTNNPGEPGTHIWASVLRLAEVWDDLTRCVTWKKPPPGILGKEEIPEGGINESTKNTIKKLVRKKLNEAKNVSIPGYEKFEDSRKESTKETKAYHKDFEKKFKDYSDFTGNDDPKFPYAENSKLNADGQYQYYRNDETQDEFIEDWRGMGLEDADGVGDIGRLSDYLDGSSETGNAQVDKDGTPLGNVVPSELGEKIKKKINRKKEKIEAQQRAMSNDKRYSPDVQNVKQVKEGVNIDIDKMKKLWDYNKKTQ